MRAADKLRVRWKHEDVVVCFPMGIGTKRDARWILSVFDTEFVQEARQRGYDLSTFKFEISPAGGEEKFRSQRPRGNKKTE